MKPRHLIWTLAIAAPVVAGCAQDPWDAKSVKSMPPSGSAFQAALQQEYATLGQMERDEGDWRDARFFVDRARMSAMGEAVAPQDLTGRHLPAGSKDDLAAARDSLIAALSTDNVVRMPGEAARAQAGFDCWLQEQEENIQPEDIAACRKMFEESLAELTKVTQAAPQPAPAPAPPPMRETPRSFVIFFPFDSAQMDDEGRRLTREIVAEFRGGDFKELWVNGHTDTSGSPEYNEALSQRRAQAVGAALVEAGAPGPSIVIRKFGEEQPDVDTGDDQRVALNRRVEIVLIK